MKDPGVVMDVDWGCTHEYRWAGACVACDLYVGDATMPVAAPIRPAVASEGGGSYPETSGGGNSDCRAYTPRCGIVPDWAALGIPVADHCQFVCYAQDEGWDLQRRTMVSASEVNALFGGRWTTESELLQRKVSPGSNPRRDTRPMWWGRQLERANMEAFSAALGVTVNPMNALFKHRDYRIGATVDGFIEAGCPTEQGFNPTSSKSHWAEFTQDFSKAQGIGLIEMKNTNTFKAKEWNVRPPLEYWTQVQCQMFVTGLTWAVLVAKIGSDDMRAYLVRYDADWCLTMRDRVLTFIGEWESLEAK